MRTRRGSNRSEAKITEGTARSNPALSAFIGRKDYSGRNPRLVDPLETQGQLKNKVFSNRIDNLLAKQNNLVTFALAFGRTISKELK